MNLLLSVATLLGALAIGAISPGPSFVFVARTSVAGSRTEGLAAAVGMGVDAVVVYGSIFAALLPANLPRPVSVILPALVFLIEAGWYSIVALALSAAKPRRAYLRFKTGIDRLAGGVLGLLGLKLLLTADPSH